MLENIGKAAKKASYELSLLSTADKNRILKKIQVQLNEDRSKILEENKRDMDQGKENKLSDALLDRLFLDDSRIDDMISSLDVIIGLEDPVGRVNDVFISDDGLSIGRKTTALGVLGIIYESRPNVSLDASALALKSSNAIILRGGEEAIHSNRAIVASIRAAISGLGFDENFVQFIDDVTRESSTELMKLDEYVDVLIPRGGKGLIQAVKKNSTVPVIETGEGNSTIYVDKYADIDKSIKIIENAKCQRTGVCNAVESLFIHKDVGEDFYQKLNDLVKKHGIKVHAEKCLVDKLEGSVLADEEDYYTEYLDLEFSIKTVDSIDTAIMEIMEYGTGHSDAIMTESYQRAKTFVDRVNTACVYVNASTRFTDGGQFGKGAELGISTQKLHARGPVGLEELTSYKYIILGNGEIRK